MSWTDDVDKAISDFFDPISSVASDIVFYNVPVFGAEFPVIVAWLAIAGLVFTVYFGFAQIRYIKLAFKFVSGKYEQKDAPGEISHFQALTSRSRAPSASAISPVWPSPSPWAAPVPPSG